MLPVQSVSGSQVLRGLELRESTVTKFVRAYENCGDDLGAKVGDKRLVAALLTLESGEIAAILEAMKKNLHPNSTDNFPSLIKTEEILGKLTEAQMDSLATPPSTEGFVDNWNRQESDNNAAQEVREWLSQHQRTICFVNSIDPQRLSLGRLNALRNELEPHLGANMQRIDEAIRVKTQGQRDLQQVRSWWCSIQ